MTTDLVVRVEAHGVRRVKARVVAQQTRLRRRVVVVGAATQVTHR